MVKTICHVTRKLKYVNFEALAVLLLRSPLLWHGGIE
jgi:hypothetical protein